VKPLPCVHRMPRARKEFVRCVQFVALHPWGNPDKRARDLPDGIVNIRRHPLLSPTHARRRKAALEYRRRNIAQFAVIYVYFVPTEELPRGVISIRAIRHGNEEGPDEG
jgi:hypothetical protein